MNRGLWFVAGAGAGIYLVIRGRRAAEAFTLDGIDDRLKALSLGARMFREEVAHGKAERETELRERFGLAPHGRPELASGASGFEAPFEARKLAPQDKRSGTSTNEKGS